jgi:CspA family cold shock protein
MVPKARRGISPGGNCCIRSKHGSRNGQVFQHGEGFGCISPEGGGKDVFVHATAVEAAGMRTLSEGQKVVFDIQPDPRGAKTVNLRAA